MLTCRLLLVPVVGGFRIGLAVVLLVFCFWLRICLAVVLTCRLLFVPVVPGFRIGLAVVLTCRLLLVSVVAGFRIALAVVLLVVYFWFQSFLALGLIWLLCYLSFAFGSSRYWL